MNVKHDVSTWFGKNKNDFVTYYNDIFDRKTLGNELAFPQGIAKQFNISDDKSYFNLCNSVANTWISVIFKIKQAILAKTDFNLFEEDTKEALRKAVCEAVQNAIMNRNIWERTNGSSLSGGNFNLALDVPAWVFTSDGVSKFAWTLIQTSGIDEYEWIGDDDIYYTTINGNVKVISKMEDANV